MTDRSKNDASVTVRASAPSVLPLCKTHETWVFLVLVVFIFVSGLVLEFLILHEKLATNVYKYGVDVG